MIRKSLFWGLTAVLAGSLVALVIQGRRAEKQAALSPKAEERVRESRPTPTRVLAPSDLAVVESKMTLRPAADPAAGTPSAAHTLTFSNSGRIAYEGLVLRITYYSAAQKLLDSRVSRLPLELPPGETKTSGEVVVEGLPEGALSCSVQVLSADLKAVRAEAVKP